MLSQAVRSVVRCSATSLRSTLPQRTCAARQHQLATVSRYAAAPRHRMYSTPPPQVNESHLSMEAYHDIADKTMEDLLETLEERLDSLKEDLGYEVDYHSGVLTLKLGSHGTYVINKQPPNKQIWLSSPLSGPKRYDFNDETGEWVYSRDGGTFDGLLSEELSVVFSEPIKIRLD